MKNIISKFALVALSLGFTACLDDDTPALSPSGYKNIIEFGNVSLPISAEGAIHPAWVVAFPAVEETTFDLIVSYSGPASNDKNIEVELEVNPFALNAYNEDQGKGYELLPEALYTFPSTVTIPKGKKTVTIPVTIASDQMDLAVSYALPLTIVSSSSGLISGNYGTGIFVTVAKNQFHGTYESNGFFQHPTSPRTIHMDKELITTALYSNQTGLADLGTPFFLTVDPVTGDVALDDPTQHSYDKGTITVNGEDYSNTYDSDTKTYYLYYEYVTSAPRTIYEKMVFLHD